MDTGHAPATIPSMKSRTGVSTIPWDANETLREPERMGRGAGASAEGVALDPFTGANDPEKALLYRLLQGLSLRERYLADIRDIARDWVVWARISPLVQQYQSLIAADVKSDTHKLVSNEALTKAVTLD